MTQHADVLSSDGTPRVSTESDPALRWRQIARSLGAVDDERERIPERASRRMRRAELLGASERGNDNVKIEVLDRLTTVSVVLSWRDSTGCSYGYQLWQKGVARRAGMCAISGLAIRRGDHIYRPGTIGRLPSNAAAMILAIYIDRPHPVLQRAHE